MENLESKENYSKEAENLFRELFEFFDEWDKKASKSDLDIIGLISLQAYDPIDTERVYSEYRYCLYDEEILDIATESIREKLKEKNED